MTVRQSTFSLPRKPRGFHLVTPEVVRHLPDIGDMTAGLCHLLIQHTSASLSLNENADPTVRHDFEAHVNSMVPEGAPYYNHTYEGADDMPAHIKASLFGASLVIPVTNGRLNLGTWQGIYLCEHRNHGGARRIVATVMGSPQGADRQS